MPIVWYPAHPHTSPLPPHMQPKTPPPPPLSPINPPGTNGRDPKILQQFISLKSTNPSAVIVRLYFSFYIVEVYAGSALILPKSLMLLYENLEAVMKSFQLSMNS